MVRNRKASQESEESQEEEQDQKSQEEQEDENLKDWTGEPEQPETEEAKSLMQVAKEVLAGEWGRGQERRVSLSREGYDPNAVQAEVIRLLNE